MRGKNIGRIDYVDSKTGENLGSVNKVYTKLNESFIMVRTTNGLDWYFPLSKNEKSLILMLHDWSDATTMRLSLAGWQREYICKTLCVERRMVSILLKGLEDKDCIKRLSQNDFMVNPAHAFKCSTTLVRNMIKEYESIITK
jgi:hypothetical protein